MIREYPDYYKKFSCIGGTCPDSCCIGWEVDIDEETFYYYKTVDGAFGKRLNAHMQEEGEDKFFPLTDQNRCPFLNDRNLCDIILNIGEESLCQVCTEYPRYYMAAGSYEQIDMSLSCMELGRIFFESEDPVCYEKAEIPGDGEELEDWEEKALQTILKKRDQALDLLRDRSMDLTQRLKKAFEEEVLPERAAAFSDLGQEQSRENDRQPRLYEIFDPQITEADRRLSEKMHNLEVLDERWTKVLEETDSLPGSSALADLLQAQRPQLEIWFEKIACYLVFRYYIDAFPDTGLEKEITYICTSLRFLLLMCAARVKAGGKDLDRKELIDLVHLYSKEVEHSEENVEFLKQA